MASSTMASIHPNAVRSSLAVEAAAGALIGSAREIGAAHLPRQFFRLNFPYKKLRKTLPSDVWRPFPTASPTA